MSVSLKQNNRSHSQISILFVLISDKEREGEIVLPCAAWMVITICQWFLITICQRSRCVSKHSGDNRVHLKPTTTRRQPEPMNPLLLWVGCELKNHPPDLVQVNCGLGKNPTCPTHGQPYTLVPKVLKPNKLPLWQSMTKHITKNKMLKVKQPIRLKSSN